MDATHYFTIYWLTGEKQHVTGSSIEHACNSAGIGAGALRAVDFYMDGLDFQYIWNKEIKKWEKIDPPKLVNVLEMKVNGQSFQEFQLDSLSNELKKKEILFNREDTQNTKKFVVRREDLVEVWNAKFI